MILGVSFDAPKANKAFKDKFSFPYDLCSDTDKSASIAYGVAEASSEKAPRLSVLIGPDGKRIKQQIRVQWQIGVFR